LHVTEVPALDLQVPLWQVSTPLHALPSLHEVPSATGECDTAPLASQPSAVHGFLSSMVAIADPLQLPPEQVPAVVPTPPAQEAAPQAKVLFVCVTCPVVALQLSVVQTFPSSMAAVVPTWQDPEALQKLAPIPCVAEHEAAVLQAVLQQMPAPFAVLAQKPEAQSVATAQVLPTGSLSPHLLLWVLHATLLQSAELAQVVLQLAAVASQT
jgi:hypothetical protein